MIRNSQPFLDSLDLSKEYSSMSYLVLLNTPMYKDRASFNEINKRSFPHCSVSEKTLNKTGDPDVNPSRWKTQYLVRGRALRLGEKEMMGETTL